MPEETFLNPLFSCASKLWWLRLQKTKVSNRADQQHEIQGLIPGGFESRSEIE
jgi:hypothetical protein